MAIRKTAILPGAALLAPLFWLFSVAPEAAEVPAGKPLIAHWTFDEESGEKCLDASGNGCDAAPVQGGVQRVRGLLGNALSFSGNHSLQVLAMKGFGQLPRISFSAWTLPTKFDVYNEIFRKEDGDHRVLFSYQLNATCLSLGLNIAGYVECRAHIEPRQVLDGAWHHCAATFDGEFLRVYLDAKEIGSLKRPGTIVCGGAAPGCIGSVNGGECFQGQIDDLRIYADALSAEEIAALYKQGSDALERIHKEQDGLVSGLYVPAKSFAETLANCAQKLAAGNVPLPRETGAVLQRKLKSDFPQDYDCFVRVTGQTPVRFLSAVDGNYGAKEAERVVGMLTEYQPLTERQWKSQTPEQLKAWQEVAAFEKRLRDLKASQDAAARFSPEWIQLLLDAGPRVQLRPYVNEAVAPYIAPATPETRSLTAAEARAALERDWLHQAGNQPTADRIKKEIEWTRQLAVRIAAASSGKADFTRELSALEQLEKQAAPPGSAGVPPASSTSAQLYFAVRALKRRIVFANPAVDFDKVLFVDMPFPGGSEWQHETRHRLGYMAVPGARLLVLEGLAPDGKLKQLMPQLPLHGSFWRPDVSYDGQKVLFCFKPHNEKAFHLYEIGVDGAGLTQLTDGPYDDFDPIYLPDGQHILFSTTRGNTYVRCMPPTNAFVLARCGLDGKNIYFVSSNNEPDYLPSVAHDGRVLYTRWEYTDKPLWRAQKLWTIHPDGTQVNMFWGNQSVWPDVLKDARSIPGSRRVMFTGSAHHNWFSGSVGILDPDKGLNFPNGLTKVTADVGWPECGNGPVDPVESPNYHASGSYAAYYSPYPLSEQDFMVSASRGGKFVLYMMDVDGNRELIYEGTHQIFHALPLKPRLKPPVIPDAVEWPDEKDRLKPKDGVIYSANVYEGAPEELRGQAKFLRVLSIDDKTYTYWNKRPYISTGPVVSGVQSEGVKRFLGTVPIEDDGSVSFYAPSGKSLHFQLLDAQQRALQTMRSFVYVMPGERRGCVGCHELHSVAAQARPRSSAVCREPHQLTPPPWCAPGSAGVPPGSAGVPPAVAGETPAVRTAGVPPASGGAGILPASAGDTVSYSRYVRPVLDKYCGKCHQGEGEGRKTFDMTPRPGLLDWDDTYWVLIGRPSWGQPYKAPANPPPGFGIADTIMVEAYGTTDPAGYKTPKPMTRLSYKSRLIERASSGKHHDVKVDAASLLRLMVWVDAMCPYLGDEEVRCIPDPEFQGVDWLSVRPQIKNAPRIVRPGPVGQ
ncbi:MAG: LamG-like jellyroll fold domain-containing protein [Planctomycetota bacterium]